MPRKITVFYAWQSDRPSNVNRHFIRKALDEAATRISDDPDVGADILIDADTEGVVGTPPVTETILAKIADADVFVPDLTCIAKTDDEKLVPNPNVLIEYGYALQALGHRAMMPVMNTHYGPPEELPFDMGHMRHPTQYCVPPKTSDGKRRQSRSALSNELEGILRLLVQDILGRSIPNANFTPTEPLRPPAFFFNRNDILVNFGEPGEQELRFKRDRAIYVRLFPKYSDQPRVGLKKAIDIASRLKPPRRLRSFATNQNNWGAINVEPHGEGITSFTQIFENGELWGVSEQPFRSHDGADLITASGAEIGFVTALDNYRDVYQNELELRPPFLVEFGATGLTDRFLQGPIAGDTLAGSRFGPIRRNDISVLFQLEGFEREEWITALRDFLIDFYDLAACERGEVMTREYIEANQLPAL